MINALLFTILIAILFPKALRLLFALLFVGLIAVLVLPLATTLPATVHAAPANQHSAENYCRLHPDARESGADDEHMISIRECAKRIALTAKTIYLDKMDKALDDRWNALDNVCRGEPGTSTASNSACDQRLVLDKIIIKKGCVNIYPATSAHDTSYWKCRR